MPGSSSSRVLTQSLLAQDGIARASVALLWCAATAVHGSQQEVGFGGQFVRASLEDGSSSTIRDMGVEQVFSRFSREEVSQPKKGKDQGQSKDAGPPVQSPVVPKPNLNPDEQLKAAQARVVKLEAAIIALGDKDPAVAGLKEALAKARAQAQLLPVQDLIAHTDTFLDRSRKKMEALSA